MSQFGIRGRLYEAISCIYSLSTANVRVNQFNTETFQTYYGVKQGDTLSPTLFSMFLNDLATGVKGLGCGIDVGDIHLSLLLYADDIVLLAPTE